MADSNSQWTPLEHQVYRLLKDHKIENCRCLLAVSGGADSMALLEIIDNLKSALQLQITVLHCHHGPTKKIEQQKYRENAMKFVESECQRRNLPLEVRKSPEELHSENDMRNFRLEEVNKMKTDFILWAHHQDDFLETQIMRLIRGAGKTSTLLPMSTLNGKNVRPLLNVSKEELKSYLQNQKIEWIEDPSNEDESYLRNWIRNNWLPQLEAKCPGALRSLSRSLDLLAESHNESFPEGIWIKGGISRPLFLTLSEAQKRQIIAFYVKECGQKEFTHNQIKEILKQLDNSQLNHTFKTANLVWSLSKDLIYAKAPHVVNAI